MYRNDLEAALLRVDDLETELAKLKAHVLPQPPTKARHRTLIALAVFAAAAIAAAILSFKPTRPAPEPNDAEAIDDPIHQVCALP